MPRPRIVGIASTNHATFFHEKKLLKPAPKASFTKLFAVFYPHALEKTRFFVVEHGRRKILHFNVTDHPTSSWITQQLREAFPEPCPYRYALLDRDSKFGKDVTDFLVSGGIKPKRIGYRCPWQNGISERWIGSCRRELLDHVVILSESHLRRLIRDYISYYHEDRIHDSLEKDSPVTRAVSNKPDPSANLISFPRVGGLHHRYDWQQAA